VACATLAALLGAPARAQEPAAPAPLGHIKRVIKLGPEAVVVEDEHGTVTMAPEPPPPKRTDRDVLGPVLSAMVGGIVGSIASGPRYVAIGVAYGGGAFAE
jgi:hypothetical protein